MEFGYNNSSEMANNTSSSSSFTELEYALPDLVTETLLALYSFATVISLVGNAVMILIVWKDRSKKRTANSFLLCLSISDILFILLCVPFTVISNVINFQWVFGQTLCKLVGYIQAVSVIQRSSMLMTSAAVQYHGFRRPFGGQLSFRQAYVICASVWLVSFIIPIPILVLSDIVTVATGDGGFTLCVEMWPDNTVRRIYSVMLMVITYLLPLLVLLVTKVHISLMVSAKPPGEEYAFRWSHRRARSRRTFAVFMTTICAHAVCWSPIHVITIIGDVNPSIYDIPGVHIIWLFAHFLAVSNSAINPAIVLFMQSSFRQKLSPIIDTLGRCSGRRKARLSNASLISNRKAEFIMGSRRFSYQSDNGIYNARMSV